MIRVNGVPLEHVEPSTLRVKVSQIEVNACVLVKWAWSQVEEPILLLGKDRFAGVDMRVRVKGGGHVSQIYGTRKHLVQEILYGVYLLYCLFFGGPFGYINDIIFCH